MLFHFFISHYMKIQTNLQIFKYFKFERSTIKIASLKLTPHLTLPHHESASCMDSPSYGRNSVQDAVIKPPRL
jgi:hypothetical protein